MNELASCQEQDDYCNLPDLSLEQKIPQTSAALATIEAAGLTGKLYVFYGVRDPISPDSEPFEDAYLFSLMAGYYPGVLATWSRPEFIHALRVLHASGEHFDACLVNLPTIVKRLEIAPNATMGLIIDSLDFSEAEFHNELLAKFSLQLPAYRLWKSGAARLEHSLRFVHMIKPGMPIRITPNEAFDRWPEHISFRLYCGKTDGDGPFRGLLTRREAHDMVHDLAWMQLGETDPDYRHCLVDAHRWLAWKHGIDPAVADNLRMADRRLIDWLINKHKLPAMLKERVQHRPDGSEHRFRYIDIIDEIRAADLVNGAKTSVEEAFFRAGERRRLLEEANSGDVELPPSPLAAPAGIRHLGSSQQLRDEGREMRHCVAGYLDLALAGASFIYSVSTAAGRSTAELKRGGKGFYLAQHKGFRNEPPAVANLKLVERWLTGATSRSGN